VAFIINRADDGWEATRQESSQLLDLLQAPVTKPSPSIGPANSQVGTQDQLSGCCYGRYCQKIYPASVPGAQGRATIAEAAYGSVRTKRS